MAFCVRSKVSESSGSGCTNSATRNTNATSLPTVSPSCGPYSAPSATTTATAAPPNRSAIGKIMAPYRQLRRSARYRLSMAVFICSFVRSWRPYARTTSAPMTLSDTAASVSPTRTRTLSYAATSPRWKNRNTNTMGNTVASTVRASCHE